MGYSLLSLIVAKASGRDFASFLRERIFLPLGMHDTVAYEEGRFHSPGFAMRVTGSPWLQPRQRLTLGAAPESGGAHASR
jgi:CubicO group peptidase (beta-lactamase class C family)